MDGGVNFQAWHENMTEHTLQDRALDGVLS
jgi:hypothetical protein